METVKTVISIEKELFETAEKTARAMNISRSELFAIALQDFIQHHKNRELLDQLDAAYSDEPDATEQALQLKQRRMNRRTVEGEW